MRCQHGAHKHAQGAACVHARCPVDDLRPGARQRADHAPALRNRRRARASAALVPLPRALRRAEEELGVDPTEPCDEKAQRHLLPELLRLSFTLPLGVDAANVEAALTRVLAEDMKLPFTVLWFPTSKGTAIVANVLPREIQQMRETVERLDGKFQVLGALVAVDAPNVPELSRCRECGQVGHRAERCTRYSGTGLRLLLKKPLPWLRLQDMKAHLGASEAYLADSTERREPHRKATFVFRELSDEAMQEMIMQRLVPLLAHFFDLLQEDPSLVRPQDRRKECPQCNAIAGGQQGHECPFSGAAPQRQAQSAAHAGGPRRVQVLGAGRQPEVGGTAAAQLPRDNMCHSWRKSKQCNRQARGVSCSFEHPESHTPPRQVCFDFRDHGRAGEAPTAATSMRCSLPRLSRRPPKPLPRPRRPRLLRPRPLPRTLRPLPSTHSALLLLLRFPRPLLPLCPFLPHPLPALPLSRFRRHLRSSRRSVVALQPQPTRPRPVPAPAGPRRRAFFFF